jgi:predicted acylesterase/phospholipase RssA
MTSKVAASSLLSHVSFSGCGWLFTWHLGVAQVLLDAGKIARSRTALLGTSGGTIPALAIATGLDMRTALE